MTGVGLAAGPTEVGELRIEVRTVNGRALQPKLRLPPACAGFETAIEGEVRRRLRRGTVTVIFERQARVDRGSEANEAGSTLGEAAPIDDVAFREAAAELNRLAAGAGVPPPNFADVIAWIAASTRSASAVSRPLPPRVEALLGSALDQLERHRLAEGNATALALAEHLGEFERDLERAAERAPKIVQHYRARLLQRVNEFAEQHGQAPIPAADLVREVAIYADRVDVAEELQRLRAHIGEVRELLRGDGEVGRRLEFLLQELLRETNTLGAKSPDTELSHTVVAMKTSIDRLREQVANLE